jgi:hypothetical protein
LAVRACRIARAVHVLAEAGLDLEAGILLRSLMEYGITVGWLAAPADDDAPDRFLQWQWNDIDERLKTDNHYFAVTTRHLIDPAVRARLEADKVAIEGQVGARKISVVEQAQAIDKEEEYAVQYRYDSNGGTHPSGSASQRVVTLNEDRREHTIHGEPVPRVHPDPDPYGVAAGVLDEILRAVARVLGDGLLVNALDSIEIDQSYLPPQ